MTQPSLLTSFDTSLVDVQRSFSSTNTNTSGSSGKENQPSASQPIPPSSTTGYVTTAQLYDEWADTYDTDGNVLQAVDDLVMRHALPDFCSTVNARASKQNVQALKILDLGCGTGRNTVKLLQCDWALPTVITGWDASPAMLSLAQEKCNAAKVEIKAGAIDFDLREVDIGDASKTPDSVTAKGFDGVLSTLVLEHLPLELFFEVLNRVLTTGGIAVVSNMHPDMGARAQAGFKNRLGTKLVGRSFVHGIEETVRAAESHGFEIMGGVKESAVNQRMMDGGEFDGVSLDPGYIGQRGRKWLGVKVWYGLVLKKNGEVLLSKR